MSKFWSASKAAFYDDTTIKAENLPGDAVALSNESYKALLEKQAEGFLIVASDDGSPTTKEQTCGECTKVEGTGGVASVNGRKPDENGNVIAGDLTYEFMTGSTVISVDLGDGISFTEI